MLRSLLISEPVTEKDKGPREVTHGDLSDLNLPRPSPQVPPLLISQLCPSQTKPDHQSRRVVMVQNMRSGVRRPWVPPQGLLSQRVFAYLLLRDAAKLLKRLGPYILSSVVEDSAHSDFLHLYQSVWKTKQKTLYYCACLSFISIFSFFFHFEFL